MVSDYSDAGQERWLAGKGIDLLRGTGRESGARTSLGGAVVDMKLKVVEAART